MKTNIFLFSFIGLFLLTNYTFSQCIPDMTVTDTDLPGEIFPLDLKFKQNQPVNMVLTIIPPPTTTQGANTFTLKRIVLKSIINKPSWMSYISSASTVTSPVGSSESGYEFVVGQKYCMLLSGTPPVGSFLGTDSMAIIVDAYLAPYNLLLGTSNQNGGYIRFTVCAATDTTCWPEKILTPGELVFKQGLSFSDTITYVPPPQMNYSGSFYNLSKVVVRQLTGLPSWVSYTINAPTVTTGTINPVTGYEMLVGHKYTINLTGTVDTSFTGTSNLFFKMDPYAINGNLISENINGEQMQYRVCQSSDTACHPTFIEDYESLAFRLMPFNTVISGNSSCINFYCDSYKPVSLKIFDLLGRCVYSSSMQAVNGTNNFKFSCTNLNLGTYIFVISDNQSVLKGKLIKVQER